jgi:hypothetical protein
MTVALPPSSRPLVIFIVHSSSRLRSSSSAGDSRAHVCRQVGSSNTEDISLSLRRASLHSPLIVRTHDYSPTRLPHLPVC